jgi:hypothetical protein
MRRTPSRRLSRHLRLLAAAVALPAIAAVGLAGCKPPVLQAACDGTLSTSSAGPVANNAIVEASGIASSQLLDGLFWVHNDSGNAASVFAVGANGTVVGEYQVNGATNVDWEDIAVGRGPTTGVPYLYLADIGDNAKARANVVIYRAPEPTVNPGAPANGTFTADAITLTYPDGAHDAEAFMVDPITGQLYIVTKAVSGAQVFRAPADLGNGSTTALTQVATVNFGYLPAGVTAADITPQGDTVALRTYFNVLMYQRPKGQPLEAAFSQPVCLGAAPATGTAPNQEPLLKSEAIGFTRDGKGYVTIAEGANPYLHFFIAP